MTTQIRGNKQIKDISITNEQIAQDAAIETSKLAEGAELLKRDGSVAATGNINLNQHQLKNVATPVDDADAVRKVDLDTSVSNLQSDIDSLDVRVDDLEAHDVVQDGRLDTAEADIVALESDVAAIEAKDLEQDGRLSSIESKNTQQDNRLTQAESDIDSLEAADVALDNRVSNLEDGLQAETTARQNADAALQSEITQLQEDLAEATNGAFITREVPSGVIDGSNRVFTLAFSPNVGSEQVFVNGNLLNPGASNDYTINDTVITFAVAPEAGDVVFANYIHDAIIVGTGSGSGGSGGATNLNGLTDVTITSPAADQVLKFNGTQWVNATLPAGTGGGTGGGTGASYQIPEFSHPEQFGTWATYTITHNLNTLHPNVLLQANYAPGDNELYPGGGWGSIDYLFWGGYATVIQGTVFTVVDANTVDVRIYRVGSGARQIRGVVTAGSGSSGSTDLTEVNASIAALEAADLALDGRVDALEAVTPFSGSYNDLSDKPTIPSLTQVESDIAALDTRVDALEAGSVNVDLSGVQADIAALDSRVDVLESNALVTREIPSGSVDGVNAVFVLASFPVLGSEQVYLNGILQESGEGKDYTISGSTITFVTAPEVDWKIHVTYATGAFASIAVGGSSGAIEIFQDEEFNWSASGRTFRTITHNKGRRPDMIKVFHKPDGVTWAGMIDYMTSNQNYGWIEWSDVADPSNQVKISIDSSALGGASPVRIRLYWFGTQDVGTASAGSFSVGGGSSAPSVYESDVVTVPYYGLAQINHTQEFVHNLGYKPTNIQVVVDDTNVSTNPYYSDPGVVLPTASNFWGVSHILGFVAQHLDVNRMIIRFYFMGQQSETKVRVRCS